MKFNIGDKVRVVRCRTHLNCEYNNTIGKIIGIVVNRRYPYELEGVDEFFREDELELVQEKQFTKADLKDGDIVIYRNGGKRIVNKTANNIVHMEDFSNLSFNLCDFREDLTNTKGCEYDIVKIYSAEYKTVFSKEEILDKAEKKYLANVIRPFRDKVKYIYKGQEWGNIKEFIHIELKKDALDLPYFKKGTMYKGMEIHRNYTLEELGL